jgi:chromosome segregation ATPase
LREENEKLKNQSRQLASQVQTLTGQCTNQKMMMDALKQELETSVKCYEECRVELHDLVIQYDAQELQIQTRANLIAELKKVKGELEESLEKMRLTIISGEHIWRLPIVTCLNASVSKLKNTKSLTILGVTVYG